MDALFLSRQLALRGGTEAREARVMVFSTGAYAKCAAATAETAAK